MQLARGCRRPTWRTWLGIKLCVLALSLGPISARAQVGADRYGAIVVDANSGNVLSAVNPDEPVHPASLTKMMTLYMLFEALRDHRVSLDQPVPVSAHAASMIPTKLGLVPGTYLTVEQAILGMVTLSANDAASALGELLGGDEDRFAQMMTLRAHALGMAHTTFTNASGLPDPDQWTTARDMAVLARHLIQDFPEEYHYFATPSFVFHGRTINNHDPMLRLYPGADGLKTGFINGTHNLVTSAIRDNVRLVGVVLGAASNSERDSNMVAQLDQGFQNEGIAPVALRVVTARPAGLLATAHAASLPGNLRYASSRRAAHSEARRAVVAAAAARSIHSAPAAATVRGKPAVHHPVHQTVTHGQTEARQAVCTAHGSHRGCNDHRQVASR
jgi:D-alanyl-D-alanine carboxypeptidase